MMNMKSMTSPFTKVCVYDRPHANAKTAFSKKLKPVMNMKSMTSSFTKVCVYDCPHANAKTVFSKKLKTSDEFEVCDVTVYESMRLRPSTRRRESSVLKSIHFEKCFRIYAFRVTQTAVYVWTQGVNV